MITGRVYAPAWVGLTVDHLIETCPARERGRGELERYGMWRQCLGEVDPDGTDLCGWCVRVWKARNRPAAPAVSRRVVNVIAETRGVPLP